MPLTLVLPEAPMSDVPGLSTIARIAEETTLDDGVRVAGELVRGRFLRTALTDALHARYFRGGSAHRATHPGRRGDEFYRRLADALRPDFFRGDDWRFAWRISDGAPAFVVAAGSPAPDAASCFLHLTPGTAPEVFARLLVALDGYGLAFRAELAGDPAACVRADTATVTVRRSDVATVARAARRLQQRSPFALVASVPAFTRQLAPGVSVADEPGHGLTFGRHRCRLVASGLVAAGHGAGTAARREAVLRTLTDAGLDPAALHLNPGNPEFEVQAVTGLPTSR
jgi:hypothetical protein